MTCTKCPKLCGTSKVNLLDGRGPSCCDLMVVGEGPGREEEELESVFVGRVGKYLTKELFVPAGIQNVRLTNSVRCRATKKTKGSDRLADRTPTIREIENCREYLVQEIKAVKPRVVVVMGNAPLASALSFHLKVNEEGEKKSTKVSGISRWEGKKLWSQEFNAWVMPMFHPSYVMRSCNERTGWDRDTGEATCSTWVESRVIEQLKDAVRLSKAPRPDWKYPNIEVIKSVKTAKAMLNDMARARTFAFDIETGKKTILGASFACSTDAGYYATWDTLTDPENIGALKKLLGSKDYVRIMHNGAFEVGRLVAAGFDANHLYFDTMLAAHLVDENFEKGLKALVWRYLHYGGYDLDLQRYRVEHKIGNDYSNIPLEVLGPYGAYDGVAEFALFEVLSEKMWEQKLMPLFNKLMATRRVLCDVERHGVGFDAPRAVRLSSACDMAAEDLEKKVYEGMGKEINLNSTKALIDVFYNQLNMPIVRWTKKNCPSVDKQALAYLSKVRVGKIRWEDYRKKEDEEGRIRIRKVGPERARRVREIASALLDLKFILKMQSSFIDRLAKMVGPDGRIHAAYNLSGTVTLRASCTIHNIPTDRLIRGLFIPRPGWVFLDSDLKSAELIYLGAESGEKLFEDALLNGRDIHTETFKFLLSKPRDYVPTKTERKIGKTLNFGIIYGMSADKLAETLGITVQKARAYIKLYFQRLPLVAKFVADTKVHLREHGQVVNQFGYIRHLPEARDVDTIRLMSRMERQAVNARIQNGAAMHTYVGMVRLHKAIQKAGLRGVITHTVHDSTLPEVPLAEVEATKALIYPAFETKVQGVACNMKVEVEAVKRWGAGNDSKLVEVFKSVGIEFVEEESK